MTTIDLGSAKVTTIKGVQTKVVHARRDTIPPAGFSSDIDKEYNKERAFYESAVLKFAETIIASSSSNAAKALLNFAQDYGNVRSAELNERNLKGRFGSPTLRRLLKTMREELATSRVNTSPGNIELKALYTQITQKLLAASRGKFGIVGSTISENGIAELEVRQVSGPAYFGLAKSGMAEERRALSMATGVCMIVKTSDNQLLVQYRTAGNAQYSEIPGASIAGMFDAKLPPGYAEKVAARHAAVVTTRVRSIDDAKICSLGILGEVTEQTILAQIRTEAREELGLKDKLAGAKVVGIAEDLTKPHHEIILLGNVTLTADQVVNTAKARYDADNNKYDIPEWCVGIPATGEAVAILLTKVRSPLPPTHAAAFLAAGKALVLEQRGQEAADSWEQETVVAYKDNFEAINAICRKTTGSGYDPMKKAMIEQGLGNPMHLLKEELEKAGLVCTAA
jgi:hypothetical protein